MKNAFFTLLDPLDRVRETAKKSGFLFVLELELRCATRSIDPGNLYMLDPTPSAVDELFSRSYGLLGEIGATMPLCHYVDR